MVVQLELYYILFNATALEKYKINKMPFNIQSTQLELHFTFYNFLVVGFCRLKNKN
jgi:hypothetical protein